MFTVKKSASNYLKQIGRSSARTSSVNVAKKSTCTIPMDHNVAKRGQTDENATFSGTVSFSSPESDFTTSHILIKSQYTDLDYDHTEDTEGTEKDAEKAEDVISQPSYSDTLSFASPESDFTSAFSFMTISKREQQQQAENEIKLAKDTFFQNLEQEQDQKDKVAYSLSYATAESDFTNPEFVSMLNERQNKQLENSTFLADLPIHENANQLSSMVNRRDLDLAEVDKDYHPKDHVVGNKDVSDEYQELRAHAELLSHEDCLPSNMEEAMSADDARAIVITEAKVPFKIVSVNSAWEGLCGYTNDECNGQTLKCIQGPETNQAAVTALMSQLLRGEEAGTVLINYRKDGSKFLNRLRVGTLRDNKNSNSVTHFVGVLKEVEEMTDHFNGTSRILVQD